MNRTCKSCGLIFKTETERGFNWCHRCFMAFLEKSFMLLIQHLWELSDIHLNDIIGLCNTMHECAVMEGGRRLGIIKVMHAQVKKGGK